VRATAVYGQQLGLKVHAILTPQPPTSYLEANLQADRAAGATLYFADLQQASHAHGAELQIELARQDGIEPFVIPFGGTVPRGTIGFVNAALELAAQIERGDLPMPDVVYVALGSMGTASGLAVGFAALGLSIQVIGVRVVPVEIASLARARQIMTEALVLLNESDPGFPRLIPENVGLHVREGFFGDGYAQPTAEAHEAVDLAAAQGLRLETTYTGKTLAAVVADARNNKLTDKTVLFWNTYNSRPIVRICISERDSREILPGFWQSANRCWQAIDGQRWSAHVHDRVSDIRHSKSHGKHDTFAYVPFSVVPSWASPARSTPPCSPPFE
jgi:D-cysteine desulfhydrase